jgi:hypothetical protein
MVRLKLSSQHRGLALNERLQSFYDFGWFGSVCNHGFESPVQLRFFRGIAIFSATGLTMSDSMILATELELTGVYF